MYKPMHGAKGTLAAALSNVSIVMQVDENLYAKLEGFIGAEDFSYLAIDDGVNIEVVQVNGQVDGVVNIERAKDGTTGTTFGVGASVYYILTSEAVQFLVDNTIESEGFGEFTFSINEPHTVENDDGVVTINIVKPELSSEDLTIDVTSLDYGYNVAVRRGAFGCCPD